MTCPQVIFSSPQQCWAVGHRTFCSVIQWKVSCWGWSDSLTITARSWEEGVALSHGATMLLACTLSWLRLGWVFLTATLNEQVVPLMVQRYLGMWGPLKAEQQFKFMTLETFVTVYVCTYAWGYCSLASLHLVS